jgi:hypothetical protein
VGGSNGAFTSTRLLRGSPFCCLQGCCEQVSLHITEPVADGTHGLTRTSVPPPPIRRSSARGLPRGDHLPVVASNTSSGRVACLPGFGKHGVYLASLGD